MEFRPLEIKVISANDLKDVNLFTKMDVYAVVSINGDRRTAQKTPVDKDCGSNPKWNYTIKFTVDEVAAQQNRLSLVFHLKSDRHLGDREIGQVHVPIKELLQKNDGGDGQKVEQNVSYSVRLANGKEKGVLYFSYKFGDKYTQPVPQPPPAFPATGAMYFNKHEEKPAMAYPAPAAGYPGQSSGHPPPAVAYPPPPHGYPYPPPSGYPPYGYPPAPATAPGYGYAASSGYNYPAAQKPKRGGMGAGLGLGLAGGLLGGMLIGDMVGDAYEAGVEDGFDFDF